MKYSGSSFSVLLVDGYNLAPAIMGSATVGTESLTEQTNPFGTVPEAHTPIGITKGTLTVGNGLYDATTDALHSALGAVTGIARIISAAVHGNTVGLPFWGFEGPYAQKYEILAETGGLTKANVTYLVSGASNLGQIIQNLATFTADWDTKTGGTGAADTPVDFAIAPGNRVIPITSNSIANPTVITTPDPHGLTTGQVVVIAGNVTSSPTINGSRVVTVISPTTFSVPVNVTVAGTGGTATRGSTTGGGVAYFHCTAFSGFSGVVMKIMHSPDDVTYAALATSASFTAIGAQRIVVAGTVDRYLSSNGDVTGSGSTTMFSGFSRY